MTVEPVLGRPVLAVEVC